MIVRCIKLKIDDNPAIAKYGWGNAGPYLTVSKLYVVLAVKDEGGVRWVLICHDMSDETTSRFPNFIPVDFFEIADGTPSEYWVEGDNIIGFKELVEDKYFYYNLSEDEPRALEIFLRYRKLMYKEAGARMMKVKNGLTIKGRTSSVHLSFKVLKLYEDISQFDYRVDIDSGEYSTSLVVRNELADLQRLARVLLDAERGICYSYEYSSEVDDRFIVCIDWKSSDVMEVQCSLPGEDDSCIRNVSFDIDRSCIPEIRGQIEVLMFVLCR